MKNKKARDVAVRKAGKTAKVGERAQLTEKYREEEEEWDQGKTLLIIFFREGVSQPVAIINRLRWMITSYAKGMLLGFSTIVWISVITASGFEK